MREISDEEAVNTNDGPVSMVFTGPVQATLVTVSCKYSLHLQNTYNQPEENSYTKNSIVQANLVSVSCKYSLQLQNPYNQPEENSYIKH